jgi:uncharacterized protein involved in cysteine biosynthesis
MTRVPLPQISVGRNFFDGFAVPWRGFRYMAENPGLWRYAVAPVLLNLLVTGLLTVLLGFAGVSLFRTIHSAFAASWWRLPVEALAIGFFVVAALGFLVAAWLVVQSVLCVWFYDRLARKVEQQLGLDPGELKAISLGPQIVDALRDALLLVTINIACLALQVVPIFGTTVGACGSYYFTCSTLGYMFLDYPLSLRGMRRKEKLLFVRRHRSHSLGLGTAAMLLAIVPVANAVFLTTAVVGGVLLHRGIRD